MALIGVPFGSEEGLSSENRRSRASGGGFFWWFRV